MTSPVQQPGVEARLARALEGAPGIDLRTAAGDVVLAAPRGLHAEDVGPLRDDLLALVLNRLRAA